MKKSAFRVLLTGAFMGSVTGMMAQNAPQMTSSNIKKVVAAMTLEEKAGLVVGTGMNFSIPAPNREERQGNPSNRPGGQTERPGGLIVSNTKAIVEGAAGTTFALPRLGITPSVVADGPARLRISPTRQGDDNTYYCTAFPAGTLLASTWNRELVNQVGRAMGKEMLTYGIDVILGPGMNIQRNPLCGRNFEYYPEDPYISGKMAAAVISGVQSLGVGTSTKHFAANNAETNRNSLNVIIGERALREIYLEEWWIAVEEAQPWTVMSSYNLINGTYASESQDLLTRILRDDWGFEGYVMTDWFGGRNPVEQMKAGNDLLMPGTPIQKAAIIQAVEAGELDENVLDQNMERILNIVVKGPRFNNHPVSNDPDLKAHALVTRQSATEGMVLLKNEGGAMPLSPGTKKLAVFGNTSYDINTSRTGSGDVNEVYSVSLVEGLENAGYTVNENLQTLYNAYIDAVKEGRPKREGFMAIFMGAEDVDTDGIYVGYRYYESFGVTPSYEFGYGLSYTTFEYCKLELSGARFRNSMTVTVDIRNTGEVAGKEVVQLYLSAPANRLEKPAMELKGFAKTSLLQPVESQTLTFELNARSLASFDPEVSAWIADAGSYAVKVGASSKDIRQNGTFELARDLTVKNVSRSLVPEREIEEIKPPSN